MNKTKREIIQEAWNKIEETFDEIKHEIKIDDGFLEEEADISLNTLDLLENKIMARLEDDFNIIIY